MKEVQLSSLRWPCQENLNLAIWKGHKEENSRPWLTAPAEPQLSAHANLPAK